MPRVWTDESNSATTEDDKRHGMLMKTNMKLLRKRPGPPKCARAFVKLIAEMGSDGTGGEVFGEVEVII